MEEVLKALRKDALLIFDSGLEAASPREAVRRHLILDNEILSVAGRQYDLKLFRKVCIVGAGKASAEMAHGVVGILGDRVSWGVVSVSYTQAGRAGRVRLLGASHPEPNQDTLKNTAEILEVADEVSKEDLVICVISGGGSSFLEALPEGVSLSDVVEMNRALLASGADIIEMNTVRKHVSEVKGGKLARRIRPATLLNLIVSDVVGDDPGFIASGPTVPDSTTFDDCIRIIERCHLESQIPDAIMEHLDNGAAGRIEENPAAGDGLFENVQSVVVANNTMAVRAASATASKKGYESVALDEPVVGDTREAARSHTRMATGMLAAKAPACIISGGETVVRLKGCGKGGRNQEFALAAALEIEGLPLAVLSAGTDGIDGATDAAGAISDGHTISRAEKMGIDAASYLGENDSYNFFSRLGDLVKTGPTGTNVMDLHVVMVGCT